jgi:hypothetical protein
MEKFSLATTRANEQNICGNSQPRLQLEKFSATEKNSRLQLHFQLEKASVATTLANVESFGCNHTCN